MPKMIGKALKAFFIDAQAIDLKHPNHMVRQPIKKAQKKDE